MCVCVSVPETSSLYSEPEEIALADVIQDPTPMQTILNPTPEVRTLYIVHGVCV